MDEATEGRESEIGICDWLVGQIEQTTYMERLEMIGRVIADDRNMGAPYLTDDCTRRLRAAWGLKKRQLETADPLPSVQGESTD